jgi:hypothetical protein
MPMEVHKCPENRFDKEYVEIQSLTTVGMTTEYLVYTVV